MPSVRLKQRLVPSVRARIVGGFGVMLVLAATLALVTFRLLAPVDAGALRVRDDSAVSDAATTVSLLVGQARALAAQYALSGTMEDQKAAEDSLATLDRAIAGGPASDGLSAQAVRYRGALSATFAAAARHKAVVDRLTAVGTDIRTILSGIAKVLETEADADVVRAGMRVSEGFEAADAATNRFLRSRAPADANIARAALDDGTEGVANLAKLAAGNRRVPRLTAALRTSVAAYADALHELVSANEALQQAAGGREAATEVVLTAATQARGKAVDSQRDAVVSMLGSIARVRQLLAVATLIIVSSGLLLGWLISRGVVRPIASMTDAMSKLAGGDTATDIPARGRADEIGEMAKSVQVFKDNMIRAAELAAGQESQREAAALAQKAAMNRTADQFEARVGSLVGVVASAATELEATARSMTGATATADARAGTVAAAARTASEGVGTVAAAAEELSASIGEIGRQVAQSSSITGQAVADAQRTNAIVQKLSEGADRIGRVVGLIANIAGQTNLLALNATIEAARAGDSGKGFAVVAAEVKSLANQTAKATDEIGTQIAEIQSATREAVSAIHAITETIEAVSAIAVGIAAAVEEQGAATAEIARNVQQTARSAHEVTVNIGGVREAATQTGTAADQVLTAAGDLSRQAEQLTNEVSGFINEVRAA